MSDSALHMAEAVIAFRLAGIAFVGTVVVLGLFGVLLRLVFLAGPIMAIGLGMTLLQILLGLQHYAKAEQWSEQALSNLSWGYLGIVIFIACWWATWAKLQEGR